MIFSSSSGPKTWREQLVNMKKGGGGLSLLWKMSFRADAFIVEETKGAVFLAQKEKTMGLLYGDKNIEESSHSLIHPCTQYICHTDQSDFSPGQ